jgi:hypothetical protein
LELEYFDESAPVCAEVVTAGLFGVTERRRGRGEVRGGSDRHLQLIAMRPMRAAECPAGLLLHLFAEEGAHPDVALRDAETLPLKRQPQLAHSARSHCY